MSGKPVGLPIPFFLREKGIRSFLSGLYNVSIGPPENWSLLLDGGLEEVDAGRVSGTSNTKAGFRTSIRWLRRLKEFSLAREVFQRQFMEPTKSLARFMSEIRKFSPRSIELEGLVIRVSEPFFSKNFHEYMRAISIAVPSLGCVLTLRARVDDIGNVAYGYHVVKRGQPIPFVNRIHPTIRPIRMETIPRKPSLSDLNFIKVSFHDMERLSRSLAFEDLCEIWSEQDLRNAKHGRRLGSACVSGGVITSCGAGSPYLTLQDLYDPESTHELFVTDQSLRLLGVDPVGLRELRGKMARVLYVTWYRYGYGKSLPHHPEILAIEPVENRSILEFDDIIGYVRVRGQTSIETLRSRYGDGIDFASIPLPLVSTREGLDYDYEGEHDQGIASQFQKERGFVRSLRRMDEHGKARSDRSWPYVVARKLLDIGKLQDEGFAEWVRYDKDKLECLLALIRQADETSAIPSTWKGLSHMITGMPSHVSMEKLFWLRDVGLLYKRGKGVARVTQKGLRIAYLAVRERVIPMLRDVLNKSKTLDVSQIECQAPYSYSILIQGLQDLRKRREVECASVSIPGCQLFWSLPSENDFHLQREANTRIKLLEEDILAVLNSVPHSLHISRISETLRMHKIGITHVVLSGLLSDLALKGKVQKLEGDMWFYNWESRVSDLLLRNPYEPFKIQAIMGGTSIPLADIHQVEALLWQLKEQRRVISVGRYWLAIGDDFDMPSLRLDVLYALTRLYIREILTPVGDMPYDLLFNRMVDFVLRARNGLRVNVIGNQFVEKFISEMLRVGVIQMLPDRQVRITEVRTDEEVEIKPNVK